MVQFQSLPRFSSASRTGAMAGPAAWLLGGLAAAAALVLGTLLAVFTAVALTVIALIGSVVLAVTGLAMKARRTAGARRATDVPGILEARKVGHQWVAYGWDRGAR